MYMYRIALATSMDFKSTCVSIVAFKVLLSIVGKRDFLALSPLK